MLGRGDEFEQGFRVIRGDLRVGQGRTELHRMLRAGQVALAVDAQGLALDAAQALRQEAAMGIVVQQGQAAF
jgi:hypothetical protein